MSGFFSGAWLIARRELKSLFVSPIAYVALSGFAVVSGWIFFNLLARFMQLSGLYMQFAAQRPDLMKQINIADMVMQPTYANLAFFLVLLFPMLSMRSLAEERRQHTDELLFTSPISTGAVVTGKFLALLLVHTAMLAMTFSYPVVLYVFATPAPALSEFASIYLGLLLMGAAFAAVGIFTSSITSNQIVAAVACFVVLLLLYVIDWIALSVSGTTKDVLEYLSLVRRYQDFVKGMVDLGGIVYFASFVAVGLFMAKAALDALRIRS